MSNRLHTVKNKDNCADKPCPLEESGGVHWYASSRPGRPFFCKFCGCPKPSESAKKSNRKNTNKLRRNKRR